MAEIMTNFTAADMPGAQKAVKKAVAPKKVAAPAPTPEPVVETPAEPTETVETEVDSTPEEFNAGE